ncbi:DUF1543 domain-containing protein [Pedobacter sp. V48]|uniref:DUF1543 domain-containing protein n=1 Tax=Pedobacter sp. V48 TaxID=509635 RepID=UPI0006646C68|nr:DUF1543 domain-containing protein [Pedobacter sp. V48]
MESPKLFMLLLGCTPPGRHTEQHDVFFTVGSSLKDIKQEIIAFWPEANCKIHIDAWREVTEVDGYQIKVVSKKDESTADKLFFLNLGGYKEGEFDELHYKMLTVSDEKATAIKKAKETAFYKHTGFEGATSHIDDKYGVDVDDVFEIEDILPTSIKQYYKLQISSAADIPKDEMHLGYLILSKL